MLELFGKEASLAMSENVDCWWPKWRPTWKLDSSLLGWPGLKSIAIGWYQAGGAFEQMIPLGPGEFRICSKIGMKKHEKTVPLLWLVRLCIGWFQDLPPWTVRLQNWQTLQKYVGVSKGQKLKGFVQQWSKGQVNRMYMNVQGYVTNVLYQGIKAQKKREELTNETTKAPSKHEQRSDEETNSLNKQNLHAITWPKTNTCFFALCHLQCHLLCGLCFAGGSSST